MATKTLNSGEKVILHKDGEITFQGADGQPVRAEKVGENTMTEARYWLSLGAAAAANYLVTTYLQKGVVQTLNATPSAVSETLGKGAIPAMKVEESQLINGMVSGAATAAQQRTELFGVPRPGTREVLFYREVAPGTHVKLRVVISPEGSISVPEGDWTPLN
ncbi:MAG: hypothetical protein ACOY93_07155 [Bacillota bacterium]